jgi:hypothetical protein
MVVQSVGKAAQHTKGQSHMAKKDDGAGITTGQAAAMLLISGLAIGDNEQVKDAAMALAKLHGVGAYAERIMAAD